MGARHFYRDPSGATVEVTACIRVDSWQLESKAEEGAVGQATIDIDDPSWTLDFTGHRLYWVVETDVASGDDVVWYGFTADQTILRTPTAPLERTWRLTLTDANTIWERRIWTQSGAKRPAETDVQRVAWALGQVQAGLIDDTTTYVDSTGGVAMDACDYRGQTLAQLVDDCAQTSGRNWFLTCIGPNASKKVTAFYQFDTGTSYRSAGSITDNLYALNTTTTFAPSRDTSLLRDPSRVYSGDYLPYDGGAVYRVNAWTRSAYAWRDTSSPSLNVKSKAKASARAARYLAAMASQHERVTTTLEVPSSAVNVIKEGMSVPFQADYLPGYGGYAKWMRVVTRSVRTQGAGARYELGLEMVGTNLKAAIGGTCSLDISGSVTASAGNQPYNAGAVGITVSPTNRSIIVCAFMATDQGTPQDTGMVCDLPLVDMYHHDSLIDHPTVAFGYAVASTTTSFAGHYTPGIDPGANSTWAAIGTAFPTTASSPVQVTGDSGLTNPLPFVHAPAVGNIVVMGMAIRNAGGLGGTIDNAHLVPNSGWTILATPQTHTSGDPDMLVLAARCVQAGEANSYGIQGTSAATIKMISEWTP